MSSNKLNPYVKKSAGQTEQLHTWRDENGDSDITRWYYDLFTGALTNKCYADGNGTSYTYLSDGKIASREWASDILTSYGYIDTATGSTKTIEYNDTTPSISNTYNLAGQLLKAEDGTGTTTFGYDSKGRQTAETNELAIITRSYDSFGRFSQCVLDPVYPGYPCLIIQYGYDVYNRLDTVTAIIGSETNTFTYSYIAGTQLISGYIALTSSTPSTILTVSKTYEPYRNLITTITNSVGSVPSVVSSFEYDNDTTGKRTARSDYYNGATVDNTFACNARGEVTNAVMNSNTCSYDFDDIGNRSTSSVNSVISTYTANQLNQYTSVNSAGSARAITHDLDGNLTFDGSTWHHSYDGENRMIKSNPHSVTNGAYIFEYRHNYKNLRVEKVKKQLSGREAGYPMDPTADPGTWNTIETRKYIWDGFNIAAEIIIDNVTPATNISYYTWGLDLSGTLHGAGGVGGLLCDTKVSGSDTNTYYALSDANGNITEYIDENGAVKAHGKHSAFGQTELSGLMKDDFTHWFSSKPLDMVTGLVQYEFRPYSPPLGVFLSRDPTGIKGGLNEVGFVGNDAINKWDYLGLWSLSFKREWDASEINMVQGTFNTLKSRMPTYLAGWKSWALAASNLPDKCAYKNAIQQELTVIYQIISMIQDGLNSSDTMNVYKKDYGDKANASVGMPWNCWPYNLGNTFNGNLYLNSCGSNPFGGWSSSDMNVTIFHELSHVANVLQESGSDGMWSDYAHNVESIAKNGSELVLSPMVNWNIVKYGNKCCPPSKAWMPVKK